MKNDAYQRYEKAYNKKVYNIMFAVIMVAIILEMLLLFNVELLQTVCVFIAMFGGFIASIERSMKWKLTKGIPVWVTFYQCFFFRIILKYFQTF